MGILINLQLRGYGAQMCWDCVAMRYSSALGYPVNFSEEGQALFGPMRVQALRQLSKGGRVLTGQILCANKWHSNYFHFLLETLPALATALEAVSSMGLPPPKGLLLDHMAPYVQSCLEKLGYIGPVLETVGEALPLQTPFVAKVLNLDSFSHEERQKRLIDVVKFLRNFFAQELQDVAQLFMSPRQKLRRVFVERRLNLSHSSASDPQRRLEPQEVFHRDLRRNGFEIVYLEGMPLSEQISLFASADELVAVHGAALTNIIFCRPSCQVTELLIDRCQDMNLFGDLASAAQLKHFRTVLVSSALNDVQESDYVQALAERGIKLNPLRLPLRYDARIQEELGLSAP